MDGTGLQQLTLVCVGAVVCTLQFPPPPAERLTGRNSDWRHLYNADVVSMPDKWEYPWYASWDLCTFFLFSPLHCTSVNLTPVSTTRLPFGAAEHLRPGVGQAPAADAVPGMVHAPVRRVSGVRMELWRREPARARMGRVAPVPDLQS